MLVGKDLTVRYDDGGPVWEYRFDDMNNLRWRNEGEKEWHKEAYRAFEADDDLIFFGHMHSGTKPAECKAAFLGADFLAAFFLEAFFLLAMTPSR